MSTTRSDGGPGSGRHGDGARPPHPTETPHPPQVTEADLEAMSQEQLARLAANLDDVEVVHNANPWPIAGHPRGEARGAIRRDVVPHLGAVRPGVPGGVPGSGRTSTGLPVTPAT